MIFQATFKNCRIFAKTRQRIDRHLRRIVQALPNLQDDLVVFRLVIRKNIDKYHPSRIHPLPHKDYSEAKPALAFFEGSATFRLRRKQLYVHFKGRTADESIECGFKRFFRELKKFKDLHFSSGNRYPDHTSIRREYV